MARIERTHEDARHVSALNAVVAELRKDSRFEGVPDNAIEKAAEEIHRAKIRAADPNLNEKGRKTRTEELTEVEREMKAWLAGFSEAAELAKGLNVAAVTADYAGRMLEGELPRPFSSDGISFLQELRE